MWKPFEYSHSYYLIIKMIRIIMAFCENKDALKLNVFQSNLFELYIGFTRQQADTVFVFQFKYLKQMRKNSQFFYLKRTHSSIVQAKIDCDHSETTCACCCLFMSRLKTVQKKMFMTCWKRVKLLLKCSGLRTQIPEVQSIQRFYASATCMPWSVSAEVCHFVSF